MNENSSADSNDVRKERMTLHALASFQPRSMHDSDKVESAIQSNERVPSLIPRLPSGLIPPSCKGSVEETHTQATTEAALKLAGTLSGPRDLSEREGFGPAS